MPPLANEMKPFDGFYWKSAKAILLASTTGHLKRGVSRDTRKPSFSSYLCWGVRWANYGLHGLAAFLMEHAISSVARIDILVKWKNSIIITISITGKQRCYSHTESPYIAALPGNKDFGVASPPDHRWDIRHTSLPAQLQTKTLQFFSHISARVLYRFHQ